MTRHFLSLYALVVIAVAVVSWGQDRLWLAFGNHNPADDPSVTAALTLVERHLLALPADQWEEAIQTLAGDDIKAELFTPDDIAGGATLNKIARGEVALLQATGGESWALKQLTPQTILALQYARPYATRGPLEWALAFLFYAAIALVVMAWLWPLTRDLRTLETATASFGNRNWLFRAAINPRSQIYPLAEAFRKMAARIDGLIDSHKDMSNAVSHEIKTPLSRMQFELEAAQGTEDIRQLKLHLRNIKSDIADLNALVSATLEYAILERADMTLNLSAHDFTQVLPAVTEYVRRDARTGLHISCDVSSEATSVVCDAHLMETVLKNLLYNGSRYAQTQLRVAFDCVNGWWQLIVDDDGPGIPEADRQRVFASFVQLGRSAGKNAGFGLGLAIVKRAIEWHGGTIEALSAPLGGARFVARWPTQLQARTASVDSGTTPST